jgi:hypothetical protein
MLSAIFAERGELWVLWVCAKWCELCVEGFRWRGRDAVHKGLCRPFCQVVVFSRGCSSVSMSPAQLKKVSFYPLWRENTEGTYAGLHTRDCDIESGLASTRLVRIHIFVTEFGACRFCFGSFRSNHTDKVHQLVTHVSNIRSTPVYRRIIWSQLVTLCTARFNIHKFYVLPTQCIYVFCVDLRTNSDYFPVQH